MNHSLKLLFSLFAFFIATTIILLPGCSLVDDAFGGDDEDEVILYTQKYEINPFESVEITYENVILSADEYTGRIGGIDVRLFNIDEKLVFIVPVLPVGETFLEFDINDFSYELAFNMLSVPQVGNPEEYVGSFIQEQQTRTTANVALIDELVPADQKQMYTLELERISQLFADAEQAFQSATEAEKLEAAQFIEANKSDVEALNLAMDEYMIAVKSLTQTKSIYDSESDFNAAYARFVTARILLISQARKIIAWTAAGAIAGSWFPVIGNGLGAAIGAGIGIGNFLLALEADNIATNQLTEFESIVDELNIDGKAALMFTNKQKQTLPISGIYNNLNAQYGSSNMSSIQSFVSYLSVFRSLFDRINEFLPEVIQIKPKLISDLTSVRSASKQIHANYLSISNVSNNKVTYSVENVEGELKVTFSTEEITDQDFTFDVNYSFNGFSEETMTQTATLSVDVDPLLGKWEAVEIEGYPMGHWFIYYFEECPSIVSWGTSTDYSNWEITETTIHVSDFYRHKNYTYYGLDLDNCSFDNVEETIQSEPYQTTAIYYAENNILKIADGTDYVEIAYSFPDRNTMVLNAGEGSWKFVRK